MTLLKPNKSMDDLRIYASNGQSSKSERRARSSSPVKGRSSSPHKSNFKRSQETKAFYDELNSIASGTSHNVSTEKLKQLSKSPLSRKLHIDATGGPTDYTIPIPFTLQLPPKLSPRNKKPVSRSPSPTPKSRSKSPAKSSKLVYTAAGYQKIDTSSSDDDSELEYQRKLDERILVPRLKTIRRPGAPTVANNKKVAQKTQQLGVNLNSDSLSIIDEASNSENSSRASTIKQKPFDAKSLPPPPGSDSEDMSFGPDTSFTTPVPRTLQSMNPVTVNYNDAQRAASSRGVLVSTESYTSFPSPSSIQSGRRQPSLHKNVVAANAFMRNSNSEPYLKINKRSFSDESHVSSISSMTTFNDQVTLSTNRFHLLNLNNRQVSSSSQSSNDSTLSESSGSSVTDSLGSWDSLQKSENFSIHDTISQAESYTPQSSKVVLDRSIIVPEKPLPNHGDQSISYGTISCDMSESESESESEQTETSVDDVVNSQDDIADIYLEQSTEISQDNSDWTSEEESASQSESSSEAEQSDNTIDLGGEKKEAEVDNRGLGKHFNFPNNTTNITNDESIRKRIVSSETYRSGAYSYYSTQDGQIEIPDLSEASFATTSLPMSVNGTTFNDLVSENETDDEPLEPIGVPSQKNKRIVTEQFNSMFSDSDTDIESSNFPLYARHAKSKSTSHLSMLSGKSLPPLPTMSKSPSRASFGHTRGHSRHKSLGNIQFDINELQVPKNTAAPQMPKPLPSARVESKPETMHLRVADPPTKVDYAVDFKEARPENEIVRSITPTVGEMYERRQQNKSRVGSKSTSSTSGSSYQSSRSDKLSASTDASDTGSVVIDLTKDKYDVCMVQRNNSTMSYRSVTERHQGKEVEVVLVDEEDDKDLESIYSKYRQSWLQRGDSSRSSASSSASFASSSFSYASSKSAKQIAVKGRIPNITVDKMVPSTRSNNSSLSSKYNSSRIRRPNPIREEEEKYFDYSKSTSYYDFNTFINRGSKA